MSSDPKPEAPIEPERLEQDNDVAINRIRALAPDLWAVQELEQRILTRKDDLTDDAESAGPGK